MCGRDQLMPPPDPAHTRSGRRRSADIGGLCLATRTGGTGGQGWLGLNSGEQIQTRFAELLSDMYTETLNAVNEHTAASPSPDLSPESRAKLIAALEGWNFEPSSLPDEDHVAACAVLFFEALFRIAGMQAAVGVSLAQIPPFIQHLRQIYRCQNSYHNFEHALDVLQATYSYLRAADMVPPLSILLQENENKMWVPPRAFDSGALVTVLSREDLFVLAIAAIGHDVGHPGFTNLFMANAAAPLSAVFDGQSPLEQLHCALLMRVMRTHGMGDLLDGKTVSRESKTRGKQVRRLLSDVVLATDMRVHAAFMERFEELVSGRGSKGGKEEKEKETLSYRRTTLCQGIIKCADISNPSRPYYISKHWAALLLREWNAQAALERHHHLPPTVEASPHPLREAHSQMFFIPAFVKPLLDLVVRGVPEMQPYAAQCDFNLALWTARLAILQCRLTNGESEKDDKPTTQSQPNGTDDKTESEPIEDDPSPRYVGAFPLALPPARFGGHFSWTETSSPASPRAPPTSRPPSSFSMANGQAPPPSSSSSGSSTGTRRRERAPSGFSSEGEGDAESVSEASFAVFSPGSRGSSTTSASPGVHDNHGAQNETANDNESEAGSEYETAWNGSESGRSSAGWTGAMWGSDSRTGSTVYLAEETGSGTAGIRAAARLAGLKSIRHGHAPHRNSWSPAMREEWVAQMSAGVS
ncbi:hypothetical protein B0H12DRAFT_1124507 [Mycena haematopus]|nr:hypothetical protein B0H12DRAFT_1124507 [Mycena haematopus]